MKKAQNNANARESEEMPAPITIKTRLASQSPISFANPAASAGVKKFDLDWYENNWQKFLHVTPNGELFIPPIAMKNAIFEAALYRGEKIRGMGNKRWAEKFRSGVMIVDELLLGLRAEDAEPERIFAASQPATPGRGGRVFRVYPTVFKPWSTTVTIHVLDEMLISNSERVEYYLRLAGQVIGMGRFRPARNGYYGRYTVESFEVQNG